jgi:hypothetical protein
MSDKKERVTLEVTHSESDRLGSAWQGVPVAWAAVASNGQPLWISYHRHDAERALGGTMKVVPLYAAPPAGSVTLTDAEREVLSEERDDLEAGGFAAHAAVITGLLARATKEDSR